jgi:hypothetical protein
MDVAGESDLIAGGSPFERSRDNEGMNLTQFLELTNRPCKKKDWLILLSRGKFLSGSPLCPADALSAAIPCST